MHYNIKINSTTYIINFKKSKRAKHLQLKIYLTGEINLIIPFRYTYKEAEIFLEGKTKWIEKKLSKLAFNRDKFRYLGYKTKLSIITDKKDKAFVISHNDGSVVLPAKEDLAKEELFDRWLYGKAKEYIPVRVNELSELYGFTFNKVRVKKLKSRWGSCSSKKNLNFNYRLMHFNTKIIDYVIIHELCHLKEMNHSEKFWSLVAEKEPNYKKYKNLLNNLRER